MANKKTEPDKNSAEYINGCRPLQISNVPNKTADEVIAISTKKGIPYSAFLKSELHGIIDKYRHLLKD